MLPWTTSVQSSICIPPIQQSCSQGVALLNCCSISATTPTFITCVLLFACESSNIFRLGRDPYLKDFPQSCSVFYLDGNYSIPNPGEWESWSPCSVSCGPQEGVQFRNRPCAKNPSLFNITDGFESRACNVDAVPCAKGDWKLMAILNKLTARSSLPFPTE